MGPPLPCLLALLATLLPASAAWPALFVREIVDDESAYTYNAIAVAPDGTVHIAYHDVVRGDLRYAVRTDGGWTDVAVDTEGVVGRFVSLVLDARGEPHLAYADQTRGVARYATASGGAWSLETVDDQAQGAEWTVLALDAAGVPHLAYLEPYAGAVRYAVRAGSAWSVETVEATGNVGAGLSLALDASGRPHLSYVEIRFFPELGFDLKHAARAEGWAVEVVRENIFAASTSLAIGPDGQPHIVFGSEQVDLARWTGSAWVVEHVAPRNGIWYSLRFDARGTPHVLMFGSDLEYAVRRSGVWEVSPVESHEVVYGSLAVDAAGMAHLAYAAGHDLRRRNLLLYATVGELLEARAFLLTGDARIRLWNGKPSVCVRLEPVAGAFALSAVDPISVTLIRGDERIVALPGSVSADGDRDRNGVEELSACFAKEDLRRLFGDVSGEVVTLATVEGRVGRNGLFTASLEITLVGKGGHRSSVALEADGGATLHYETSVPGPARVSLYDLRGRRVRTLLEAPWLDSGLHRVRIERRSGDGPPLGRGIYFYRIESREGASGGRVPLLQ